MGLIGEIMAMVPGKKRGTSNAIRDVEAALARLNSERDAARQAIATGSERRRALLRDDASDDDLDRLEAEIDRAHRAVEKCEIVEVELLDRLGNLRSAARQEQWAAIVRRWDEAAAAHITLLRRALASQEALRNISTEARGRGFEHEVQARLIPPPVVLGEIEVDRFHAEVERVAEGYVESPRRPVTLPPRTPGAPMPAMSLEQEMRGRTIGVNGQPHKPPAPARTARPPASTKPAPVPRRAPPGPPAEGETRVVVVRNGYQSPDGVTRAAGEHVNLPSAQALDAARGGAVDLIEGGDLGQ